jgi:hypothetical protein
MKSHSSPPFIVDLPIKNGDLHNKAIGSIRKIYGKSRKTGPVSTLFLYGMAPGIS